jgi:hypothetical protein
MPFRICVESWIDIGGPYMSTIIELHICMYAWVCVYLTTYLPPFNFYQILSNYLWTRFLPYTGAFDSCFLLNEKNLLLWCRLWEQVVWGRLEDMWRDLELGLFLNLHPNTPSCITFGNSGIYFLFCKIGVIIYQLNL